MFKISQGECIHLPLLKAALKNVFLNGYAYKNVFISKPENVHFYSLMYCKLFAAFSINLIISVSSCSVSYACRIAPLNFQLQLHTKKKH